MSQLKCTFDALTNRSVGVGFGVSTISSDTDLPDLVEGLFHGAAISSDFNSTLVILFRLTKSANPAIIT